MKPLRNWDWGYILAIILCAALIVTYTMLAYSYGRAMGVIQANENCAQRLNSQQPKPQTKKHWKFFYGPLDKDLAFNPRLDWRI